MSIRPYLHRPAKELCAGLLALTAFGLSPAAAHAAADCASLAHLALPDARITAAEPIGSGTYAAPESQLSRIMTAPGMDPTGAPTLAANRAFCRIAATLSPSSDSAIRMEVWLPLSGWNGKMLAIGNFGWAGALMPWGMQAGLAKGYAVASNDSGHDAAQPGQEGGAFALGHPEKLVDYGYRANHVMTLRAKELIRAFYGKAPDHAYWIGCSLGGLQGLIEAKRFPEDYDGIVAGAPPNPIVNFNAEQLWSGWFSARYPEMQVPRAKFEMVAAKVLADCGGTVGKAQGFVEEPDRCGFDPQTLLCPDGKDAADCLTEPQLKALAWIYRGPIVPQTGKFLFPGPAKGNEAGFSADGRPFSVALDLFKYAVFQDPDWDWTTLDWDKDIARAEAAVGSLLHVDDDLGAFFARDGKLLIYIGWNDGHNPEELIGYYRRLIGHGGPATQNSTRLFTIPGMGHCLGGAGCDTFEKLGVIDAWVANNKAPEAIDTRKIAEGRVVRSRPICAWPAFARWNGKGAMDNAASFSCVTSDATARR